MGGAAMFALGRSLPVIADLDQVTAGDLHEAFGMRRTTEQIDAALHSCGGNLSSAMVMLLSASREADAVAVSTAAASGHHRVNLAQAEPELSSSSVGGDPDVPPPDLFI